MKKKIIVAVICVLLVMSLLLMVGCNGCNKTVFDVDYNFTHAYIKIGGEWKTIEISSWTDYEGEQIQIKLADGTVILTSAINCILYNGKLPK